MPTDVTVLVVGAGPTGLLLGAELVRRGIECQIIDANPAPLHWDRATVVHARSLEIFESLGIVEPFIAQGAKQRIAKIESGGKLLGTIDLSTCGSRYGYNVGVSEEFTESVITKHLEKLGGKVTRASKLTALKDGGDRVIATIDRNGKSEQLSAHWVVGCDGIHSITRESQKIELTGHDITEPWAVFDTTLTNWTDVYEANFAFFDTIPVHLTALPDHRWRVYLRPSSSTSDLVADALGTVKLYCPNVRFDNVTNPNRFHCHTKLARQYRSGRVMLAGDAAHICSPAQGHGMNSGLLDAFNLGWKLALVCKGDASSAILDTYQSERRPAAEIVTASGDDVERIHFVKGVAERRARDAAIHAAFEADKPRHHEAVAEAELNIDYSKSPIVMGDKHATLGPGHRIPDTVNVDLPGGESCFLHQHANHIGHTALLIGNTSTKCDDLTQLRSSIESRPGRPIVDAVFIATARPETKHPRITAKTADQFGVSDITLLVVRPDGHVGLRADRDHVKALAAYQSLLTTRERPHT
ncbi:MAG: FAD-dependent oxidoreductase [Phycisphaerales bacterium]